jgi:polar amino acid transport system substrate-binding protein
MSTMKTIPIRLALIALLAASSLVAGAAYAQSILDQVKKRGELRAGLRTTNAPFAFYNEKGEWVGFEVDLVDEIGKRLSVKVKKRSVDARSRITFLVKRRIDLAVATITHTRERDQTIDFTISYFFDGQRILARKGEFKSLKEFVSRPISTVQDTTSERNIEALLRSFGDKNPRILSFRDHTSAFLALKQGKVDGYTTDSTILLATSNGDPKVEMVGEKFSNEPYGMGVPQNDSEWRDTINFILQDMWRDGTYLTIYNRWFGSDSKYSLPLQGQIELWP